ncbi:hypothetical protein ACCT05_10660 [Rhizobium ruizarguesonis]
MDFLAGALQAIPQAATSPFAFVSYVVAVLAWVAIAFRVRRNEVLMANIDKLEPKDRLKALEVEMGAAVVRGGIAPDDWLKQKRQLYYLLGFLALIAAAIVVFVIAVSDSKAARSRAELGAILNDRTTLFVAAIGKLIDDKPSTPPASFDGNAEEYEARLKTELKAIKTDAESLITKQKHSLADANMVRFYEIGNQLNSLADRIEPLIEKSSNRTQELQDLAAKLGGLNPVEQSYASSYQAEEIVRTRQLTSLKDQTRVFADPPGLGQSCLTVADLERAFEAKKNGQEFKPPSCSDEDGPPTNPLHAFPRM